MILVYLWTGIFYIRPHTNRAKPSTWIMFIITPHFSIRRKIIIRPLENISTLHAYAGVSPFHASIIVPLDGTTDVS
jgi:hypothetical protein